MVFTFIYSFIYLNVFYVHWCKGIRFPGNGVTDNYDLPYWELTQVLWKRNLYSPSVC